MIANIAPEIYVCFYEKSHLPNKIVSYTEKKKMWSKRKNNLSKNKVEGSLLMCL